MDGLDDSILDLFKEITGTRKTLQIRRGSSDELSQLLSKIGPFIFENQGILEMIENSLNDKGRKPDIRLGAVVMIEKFCEAITEGSMDRWIEPYIFYLYPHVLALKSDKNKDVKSEVELVEENLVASLTTFTTCSIFFNQFMNSSSSASVVYKALNTNKSLSSKFNKVKETLMTINPDKEFYINSQIDIKNKLEAILIDSYFQSCPCENLINHISLLLALSHANILQNFEDNSSTASTSAILSMYLSPFLSQDQIQQVISQYDSGSNGIDLSTLTLEENNNNNNNSDIIMVEDKSNETLCDYKFNLAYGGKILLHQARLFLKRTHIYGVIGPNGCGKSTLLRNIAKGAIDGLPEDLHIVYCSHDMLEEYKDSTVIEFLANKLKGKANVDKIKETLCNFDLTTDEVFDAKLSSLSGGQGMKVQLVFALLIDCDLLLLDEPTNHLDTKSTKFLVECLKRIHPNVSVVIVSHNGFFLDDVCSDIIVYIDKQLELFDGTLEALSRPDSKHYEKIKEQENLCDIINSYYTNDYKKHVKNEHLIYFPIPGKLDGIRSKTQTILKMEHVTFTYPGSVQPQLKDVSIKLTLGSRIAVVGENGAGKSTLIKLLVGEILPDGNNNDNVWKHHNLRIAYVAQHSFNHIDNHLDKSPVEYLRWRFCDGYDREALEREAVALTAEEKSKMVKIYGRLERIVGRRLLHRKLMYEVKFHGKTERENKWISKAELESMGFAQLIKQADEKIAAEQAGLDQKRFHTDALQHHLNDFGLKQEYGTYGKIKGLSGGQKVKLVLSACMWNKPHLLILDEPTNFLDRDSLVSLAVSLKEFMGAILIISHMEDFYSLICEDKWLVANCQVDTKAMLDSKKKIIDYEMVKKEKTEIKTTDSAGGNSNKLVEQIEEVDKFGKPLSKAEIRRKQKANMKKNNQK